MSNDSLFPKYWGLRKTTDIHDEDAFLMTPDFLELLSGNDSFPKYTSPFGPDSLFAEKEQDSLFNYMKSYNISEIFVRNSCFEKENYACHVFITNNEIYYEMVQEDVVKNRTNTTSDLEEIFFVFKQENRWINNNNIAESQVRFLCKTPLILDVNEKEKFTQLLKEQYQFSNTSSIEKQRAKITKSIEPLLSNPFYKDVGIQVNVTIYEDQALFKYGIGPSDNFTVADRNFPFKVSKVSYTNTHQKPEIVLDFILDEKTGKILVKHQAAADYLQEFEGRWNREIKERDIKANIKRIRAEVIADFESAATKHSFYEKFIQSSKALLHDKIAGYTEGILATQKIAKHVWEEGTVNQSVWYTENEEHKLWPSYIQVDPFIGGLEDGIVDEIVGIPLAIKGIYEIVTEEEKRAALAGLFSKEGMQQLYQGLISSAEETVNDQEKTEHFVGVASVNVISMMSGLGFIGKSKKIVDSAEEITNFTKEITNSKVLNVLKEIREGNIKDPKVFHAVEDFMRTIEPKTLNALADAPGFDKAIKEMSSQWNKFHGGTFVMEYAGERIGKGKTLKFEVETLDRVKRYDIQFEELLPNGRKLIENLELKNWVGFWGESIKKQFTKDLKKMEKLGDVKWIFSKKGVNQSMGELRTNVIKNLKKADGSPIDELNNIPLAKVKIIVGEVFEDIDEANKIERLLEGLNNPVIFNKIFEIVD